MPLPPKPVVPMVSRIPAPHAQLVAHASTARLPATKGRASPSSSRPSPAPSSSRTSASASDVATMTPVPVVLNIPSAPIASAPVTTTQPTPTQTIDPDTLEVVHAPDGADRMRGRARRPSSKAKGSRGIVAAGVALGLAKLFGVL